MSEKNGFFPVAYSVSSGAALQEVVLTLYNIEPIIVEIGQNSMI